MKGSELQQHANSVLGLVIADRYRLDRVLGIGGTGVVYQARCLEEERDFAVKTIRKDLAHQRAIARFSSLTGCGPRCSCRRHPRPHAAEPSLRSH